MTAFFRFLGWLSLSLTLNAAIAFAFAELFAERGNWWTAFGFAFAFLFLSPVVLGVRNIIQQIIAHLITRTKNRKLLEIELSKFEYPAGGDYNLIDVDDYLVQVMADKDLPDRVRINAAKMKGALEVTRTASPVRAYVAISNLEAALLDYFRRCGYDKLGRNHGNLFID